MMIVEVVLVVGVKNKSEVKGGESREEESRFCNNFNLSE